MKTILAAKNLRKVFGEGTDNPQTVLKDVHVAIKEGEFVSVMGPSGSGKSTLLYNISGMDKATAGEIAFDGQDLLSLSESTLAKLRLTKMGFIFQHSHLLQNLNILDNVVLPAYHGGVISKTEAVSRAEQLLADTGVSDLASHDITQASGGQLQRVGICRALINSPAIIFGDEPTGALDSKASNDIMEILADINQKQTTIMLVTHDAKVALKTERVIFMLDGNIVSELVLGKYNRELKDQSQRESKLSHWLNNLGF